MTYPARHAEISRRHPRSKSLLWVDDDIEGYGSWVRSLRASGLSICAVKSAEEGWQVLRSAEVHLAIVDLKLETNRPNGVDFCLEARAIAKPARLPILVYTRFRELFTDGLDRCRPDDVVEKKGSEREDLYNAIWNLIGGRPAHFLRSGATKTLREVKRMNPLDPTKALAKADSFAKKTANYIVREKERPNVDGQNIASAAQLAADVFSGIAEKVGHRDLACRDAMLSLACFWRMRADLEDPVG